MIGTNPSTAGPLPTDPNDPTIWRLIDLLRGLRFGRLLMVNLTPFQSPHPAVMLEWFQGLSLHARHEHLNQAWEHIIAAAREASPDGVFAAWGHWPKDDGWPDAVRQYLDEGGIALHAFGFNANGSPRHPMARGLHRIPNDVQPVRWSL